MNQIVRYPGEMVWQELREFPGKGEVTILGGESTGGAKTIIIRLLAGGRIEPTVMWPLSSIMCSRGNARRKGRRFSAKAPTDICRNMQTSQRLSQRTLSRF